MSDPEAHQNQSHAGATTDSPPDAPARDAPSPDAPNPDAPHPSADHTDAPGAEPPRHDESTAEPAPAAEPARTEPADASPVHTDAPTAPPAATPDTPATHTDADAGAGAAAAQAAPAGGSNAEPEHDPADTPTDAAIGAVHRAEPRILALMNQKGGVGKTTTAVNVGAALARAGLNVLMIDLDPQAHLTLSLGLEPSELDKSVYHLLTERETTATQIAQQVDDRLGVLPAEVNLAGAEGELADRVATGAAQSILRNKTSDLVRHFDYVLIDCPPSLGLLTVNALTLAKEVIVPMQAHFLALQGLSKLLDTVQMVREGINHQLVVSGIVLCMHEGQTILASEVAGDLRSFFDEARGTDQPWSQAVVFDPPVRRNIKLAECPSFGQPIFGYAPDSHGASDYARLAKSILQHHVTV